MDGWSFLGSGIQRLDVEPDNPFYRKVDDFVIKLDESKIIFYCGSDAVIIIPDFVQIVGDHSFHLRESIRRVMFASGTQISSIGESAFASCQGLESIIFPSSLKSVGKQCFYRCHSLHSVTFESGSELGEIHERAFGECRRLESICVPASVTHLGESSFHDCVRLTMITIPADSKLRCIDFQAFAECSSLQSLVVPSSVEEILSECFVGCSSLSSLTFSSPSHVVILGDLPPMLPAFTAIPDSVRSLMFRVGVKRDYGYTLTFSMESEIDDVTAIDASRSCRRQSFLIFPTGKLKSFRCRLEFWN
jgi:hypothetical protein